MPAVLVLTGASGSGKTALLRAIEALALPGVLCIHCDSLYHDLPDEVRADGETAQDAILEHWLQHVLAQSGIEVAVLDTQIRPHKAHRMLRRFAIVTHQVVLVECEHHEREARLRGPRAQPELANPQMESWAAYLRGQADALGLATINTSKATLSSSAARLRGMIEALQQRASGVPS